MHKRASEGRSAPEKAAAGGWAGADGCIYTYTFSRTQSMSTARGINRCGDVRGMVAGVGDVSKRTPMVLPVSPGSLQLRFPIRRTRRGGRVFWVALRMNLSHHDTFDGS
ncbi:hypothetical protein AVEN_7014-1 [Araneus ventricosus]|uniref:Uncharacterized protein n=1 Tax=Araneus ventricosus TaxID=182803 RepID=A0A4Y2IDR0_ARAVE|nr:hypothetical protein AVEN_7014-1 [Araneus ventricosus]